MKQWIKKLLLSIIPILIFLVIQSCIAFFISLVNIFIYTEKITDNISNEIFSYIYNDAVIWVEIISLVISVIIFYFINKKNKDWITIQKLNTKKIIRYSLAGLSTNLVLTLILNILPSKFIDITGYKTAINIDINTNPLLMIIAIGLCAPIVEEIVFRYFIYNILRKSSNTSHSPSEEKTHKIAAIINGVMFGLIHCNIIQICYAFAFGYMFAKINEKEKNILPGIIMHVVINLSSALLSIFLN